MYSLNDLEGDYSRRPKYISFNEQQRLLKIGYESDNSLKNTVISKFINRLNFTPAASYLNL